MKKTSIKQHFRHLGMFSLALIIMLALGMPAWQQPTSVQAQGIFGCPLPQRDCELLINALENTAVLSSVNIKELNLAMGYSSNGGTPSNIAITVNGPTTFGADGAIEDADWGSEVTFGSLDLPFNTRVIDRQVYFDLEPNNASNAWITLDSETAIVGSIDFASVLNTLSFQSLLDILNELSDGVAWTMGNDVVIEGNTVAVFNAQFTSASLVKTTFAYEQFVILLEAVAEQIGIEDLDQNLVEFALDFIINGLSDQLGGATFTITWMVGRDDEQLYGVNMISEATIDLLFLSFLVNDAGILPERVDLSLLLDVGLSSHNIPVMVAVPDEVNELDAGVIDALIQQLLDIFLDDSTS